MYTFNILYIVGSSCTFFRLRKALVESQASITGAVKGMDYKNWPLTLTMSFKLMLAFSDLVTDILFAFFDKNITDTVSYLAKFVLVLQVVVLSMVVYGFVKKIVKKLRHNKKKGYLHITWIKHIRLVSLESFESTSTFCQWLCCRAVFAIVYSVIGIIYLLFIGILSLVLGLTKLLAVKQIQQWWLGLIFYNYNEELEQQNLKHKHDINDEKNDRKNNINDEEQNDEAIMLEIFDVFGASPDAMAKSISVISSAHSRVASEEMNMRSGSSVLPMSDVNPLSHEQEYEIKQQFSIGSVSNTAGETRNLNYNIDEYKHGQESQNTSNWNDTMSNYNLKKRNGNDYLDIQMAYIQLFKQLREEQKQIQDEIEKKSSQGETDTNGSKQALQCQCCINIKNYYYKSRNKKITNRLGWKINNVKNMPLRRRIVLFIDLFTPQWMEKFEINCTIYNSCMMSEIIVETIPQLTCM